MKPMLSRWTLLVLFVGMTSFGCGDSDGDDQTGQDVPVTASDVADEDLSSVADVLDPGDGFVKNDVINQDMAIDALVPEDLVPDDLVPADLVPEELVEDVFVDIGSAAPVPFVCNHSLVAEGWNEGWSVAGKTRKFFAKLPANTEGPIGVVFVFYGLGDSVNNFKAFFNANPDADPDFPMAIIYPQSMALMPFGGGDSGIEWSVLKSQSGVQNPDVALFEAMLGCLNETIEVDANRIFAFGFSAGAIMTNLLHSRYPDLLSAVVSMSGAWFNDSFTVAGVNTMGMATLDWDDISYEETGTVLMTHGGATDTYGMMGIEVIDFEQSAQYGIPFLKDAGRTVIDCVHNNGHTNHPGVPTGAIIQFFMDHASGGVSPYAAEGNLPDWFDDSCTLM